MYRLRMRFNRIQEDPLLTPKMSLIGMEPKQLIRLEYQDYSEYDHYREQMISEYAICPEQNDLTEKQI